jgi:hypothetical protein
MPSFFASMWNNIDLGSSLPDKPGNGKGKGKDEGRLEISMVTGTVVSPEFELSELSELLELELSGWTWAECWERSKAKAS